jgi:imidazolonepropionase
MLSLGVTTVEGKSGYGLDLETELRQLEAMRILAASHPVDVVPTFLGAHSVPDEFRGRSGDYVAYVAREVLPEIARRPGLARFCDVFCEKGVFSVDESRALLRAAKRAGFELKIHADEIERTGGSGLAAELGARSADHLLKADPEDIRAMANAGVVATCLPLTAFTLGEPFADARMMIESGCAVAVASDFNPGSCPSHSIPLAIALSVLRMGMTMAETLTALTLNGAAALGLADVTGSVEAGKRADFLVLADEDHRFLAYRSAMDRVAVVVKDGLIAREKRDVRS